MTEVKRFESMTAVKSVQATVRNSGPLFITEGVLEAISLHARGLQAVAVLKATPCPE